MTNAPLPTTILKPSPAASPSAPLVRPQARDDQRLVRLGDLVEEHVACPFCRLRVAADDDGARRLVVEHEHRAPFGDRLVGVDA